MTEIDTSKLNEGPETSYSISEAERREPEDNSMEVDGFSNHTHETADAHESEVNGNKEDSKEEGSDKNNLNPESELSFIYKNNIKSKMDVELVKKYPDSYIYQEYMSGRRTENGDVLLNCDGENDELIVKYMKDDESLIKDLKKMSNKKRTKLLDDLKTLSLPEKKELIKEIQYNNAIEERRVILVNGKNERSFRHLLKQWELYTPLLNSFPKKEFHYYSDSNTYYKNIKLNYLDVIEDYLTNNKVLNHNLIKRHRHPGCEQELIDEMKKLGIELTEQELKEIQCCFYQPKLAYDSFIIDQPNYDECLQQWLGSDHKWKLIYRASEHDYTAESFHEICDDVSPTLIIIKSSEGWIFGGYTTQCWSGNCDKDDDQAFLFTLKNPCGVEPTRYKKKANTIAAISCNPYYSPMFGSNELCLENNCNVEQCSIHNYDDHGYECHFEYKLSMLVSADCSKEENKFLVSDFEVYTMDIEKDVAIRSDMYQSAAPIEDDTSSQPVQDPAAPIEDDTSSQPVQDPAAPIEDDTSSQPVQDPAAPSPASANEDQVSQSPSCSNLSSSLQEDPLNMLLLYTPPLPPPPIRSIVPDSFETQPPINNYVAANPTTTMPQPPPINNYVAANPTTTTPTTFQNTHHNPSEINIHYPSPPQSKLPLSNLQRSDIAPNEQGTDLSAPIFQSYN